jgi:hypothetical protein
MIKAHELQIEALTWRLHSAENEIKQLKEGYISPQTPNSPLSPGVSSVQTQSLSYSSDEHSVLEEAAKAAEHTLRIGSLISKQAMFVIAICYHLSCLAVSLSKILS